ncbi:hypothetical protein [Tannockella kyphosi]|uniref:hypothetical protein n=1 Tax=Tannockella kyphosi TaxID=2899121 RepID=UPI00201329D0|nr:hypothetical protein [Tannockella kyphosi]
MRTELEEYCQKKISVQAIFHHFGYTRKNGVSILLNQVKVDEKLLCEHVWIAYQEEFQLLNISNGTLLEFDANVTRYQKSTGYDYGFFDIHNIKVVGQCDDELVIDSVGFYSFPIKKHQAVWQSIKGEKQVFLHDETREIQQDIHILSDDQIDIELYKIKEYGVIEFVWRIKRENRWNKGAMFNPIKYGQAIMVYSNYLIYLPESIYFELKDFYFKVYYSKTNIHLPYLHETRYYQKPKKFKDRKVIFYDHNQKLIEDKEWIQKREYIYYELENILKTMEEKDIDAIYDFVYHTNVHIKAYYSNTSAYFMQRDYLINKTMNCFRSASIDEKRKYIEYMENYLKVVQTMEG